MADLITVDRAKLAIPNGCDLATTVVAPYVSAASAALRNWCGRQLSKGTYTEELTMATTLFVAEWPVASIDRVAVAAGPGLTIRNTTAQRATVAVLDAGLRLSSVTAGVATTTLISFATYPTFATLAAAVAGVSGWTASVPTGVDSAWASADLVETGPVSAGGSSTARLLYYGTDVEVAGDLDNGILSLSAWCGGGPLRVVYTGGLSPIPGDLQEATAKLVSALYAAAQSDPTLTREKLDRYEWESNGDARQAWISAMALAAPYRRVAA